MKNTVSLIICVLLTVTIVTAQESDATDDVSLWEFNAAANTYFIPDDFFILPVFIADKNKLHLEGRYNYEDRETFSGWVGYNFQGGKKLEYKITPMIGGVVGLSNGFAPGLEVTLNLKNFEFYTEGEYYIDFETSENHFMYFWTDIAYAPIDWLWVGISGQRTRLYQTELDIQRGLMLGGGVKQWEVTTYAYNITTDDFFFLVTLSIDF